MQHKYIPNTQKQKAMMLEEMGRKSSDELFSEIPKHVKMTEYNLHDAHSELEVINRMQKIVKQNQGTNHYVSFLGAGSYDHYIPTVIPHLVSRSEFATSYTPYQPEVAQGTLQYIFEYQTMMCELTGLDVSNASMYDGATAVSEAISMAGGKTRRKKVLVSSTLHPHTIDVIKTYAHYRDYEVTLVPHKNGQLDKTALQSLLDESVSCFVGANPNFYGLVEDYRGVSELLTNNKSLFIMNVNPMSLGILKTPHEYGVDICVGDAQVFGIPQSFGGPYIGFLTTTEGLMRRMPGRICGQTTDVDGKRAFVLTLQAREQHIRREKANSNICSNQSLNALTTSIYLSIMGKEGIKEVAYQSMQKAHYAFQEIIKLKQFEQVFDGPFFNEFVVKTSLDVDKVEETLRQAGILSGLHLKRYDDKLSGHLLFCVTEKRTKEEIDRLVDVLGGIQ